MDWLKELLEAQGLEAEQVTAIVESYKTESPKHVVPKSVFNNTSAELKAAQDSLAERDKQLNDLKDKSKDEDSDLQAEITKLQKENKEAKERHEAELTAAKFENAIEVAIITSKAKNAKAVRALLDADTLKLEDDGTVKGITEQLDALKESDAYLFGNDKPVGKTPPSGGLPGDDSYAKSFAEQINEQSGAGLDW